MARKSGETAATVSEPPAEPAQVPAAEPQKVTAAEPQKVTAAEPQQVTAAEPKQVLAAASSVITTGQAAGGDKTQPQEKTNMAIKTAEDFVAFNQGNVEALVKAGQVWAAGVQDLSKSFAATAQAQVEETLAAVKALSGVKSLKEAVDLQTNLARVSLEKAVTETSKLTDASVKLAEQTWAPLTARVTLAVEKFGRAA
jgi:phasin family protein